MITLPMITGFVAAILAIIFIILQLNVIRLRVKTGVSLFHADQKDLGVAIRQHANLAENIPFALILLALLEMLGGPDWVIYVLGFVLIIGRIVHPFGIDYDQANRKARGIGALSTQAVMAISALWLIGIYFAS